MDLWLAAAALLATNSVALLIGHAAGYDKARSYCTRYYESLLKGLEHKL